MLSAGEILFLLCLPLLTYGQNLYHLRDDGVYDGRQRILQRDFSKSRVTMGFNGIDLFIAEGNFESNSSTIFRLPTDGSSELVTFKTIFSSYDISIDCCCQYVVYAYPDAVSGYYKVQLRSTARDGVSKDFLIRDRGLYTATVVIDCEAMTEDPSSQNSEIIRVITGDKIYKFNIHAASILPEITDIQPLVAPPRCAAFWNDGVDEYLFTAYEDRDQIQVTAMKSGFDNLNVYFRHNGHLVKTACVSTSGNNLYSFSRHTSEIEGYLFSLPPQTIIDDIDGNVEISSISSLVLIKPLESVGDFVNGISVCDSCADNPCLTTVCAACNDPGFETCGFCSRDSDVCFCSEPSETGCSYDSPTLEDRCRRPIPKLDAHCVVFNPLANRRKPGPIDVAVVVAPKDQSNYDRATLSRAAKTGRWPVTNMPIMVTLPKNAITNYSYSALLQDKARGMRFGFFEAEVHRRDGLMDEIYCITSEKSAFTNEVFTYTVAKGESVTMRATMKNVEFLDEVKWGRTTLVTGEYEDLRNDGRLSLTYTSVNKEEHEGVYEVYRLRRRLRTWHPIIYLYVRSCTRNKFGNLCQSDCPYCGYGVCEVSTGACRCYPGFTGTNCESACSSPDQIGEDCDIDCSTIFPGGIGENCINLEICGADDLGCACRSGLQPPDCKIECAAGKWGPNCSKTCNCGPFQTCDVRTGCV